MASKPVGFNQPLKSGQTIGLPSTMNLNRSIPTASSIQFPSLPTARPMNMTIPKRTSPAGPAGPAGSDSANLLSELYNQTVLNKGPTSTSKSTQTTQQARSPELEQQIATQTGRLNDVSQGFQGAFQGKLDSFDNILRALATAYQSQASSQSNAVGTGALQSGLTPLEATQRSSDTISDILQKFYADQANVKGQQADVPIALQQALQGVSQQHQGLLQNVISPYQQNVAGQTTTGSQEQTDTLGQTSLLARLAQAMQQSDIAGQNAGLEQQKMDQQQQQFLMQMALEQAGLTQRGELALLGEQGATGRAQIGQQGANQRAALGEQGSMARLLQQITGQQEQGAQTQEGALMRALLGEQGANQRAQLPFQGMTPFQQGSLQNRQQGQLMDYLASLASSQQRGTAATNKATADASKQQQLVQHRAATLGQRSQLQLTRGIYDQVTKMDVGDLAKLNETLKKTGQEAVANQIFKTENRARLGDRITVDPFGLATYLSQSGGTLPGTGGGGDGGLDLDIIGQVNARK